mgnify:CR=1 FL=1
MEEENPVEPTPPEVPPVEPIPTVSRAEAELAALEIKREALLLKVQQEREARDNASIHMRRLAIALHTDMCMADHSTLSECSWYVDLNANDPVAADWQETAHWRWILVANAGIYFAIGLGWTVQEPVEPAP